MEKYLSLSISQVHSKNLSWFVFQKCSLNTHGRCSLISNTDRSENSMWVSWCDLTSNASESKGWSGLYCRTEDSDPNRRIPTAWNWKRHGWKARNNILMQAIFVVSYIWSCFYKPTKQNYCSSSLWSLCHLCETCNVTWELWLDALSKLLLVNVHKCSRHLGV